MPNPNNWTPYGVKGSTLISAANRNTKSSQYVGDTKRTITAFAPITAFDQRNINADYLLASSTLNSAKENYAAAQDKAAETTSLKDDLKAAKVYLASIETAIQKNSQAQDTANSVTYSSTAAKTNQLAKLTTQQSGLSAAHTAAQATIDSLNAQIATIVPPNTITDKVKTPDSTPVPPPGQSLNFSPTANETNTTPDVQVESVSEIPTISRPSANLALTYNAGTVADAYFSSNVDYLKETTYRGNTPQKIERAVQLFNSSANSKGMFVMTNPVQNKAFNAPSSASPGGGAGWSYDAAWVKWGFQFLYNPATITMNYAMAPAVDLSILTSGQEGANLVGTDGNYSTISFEVIINRMFDMKYFTKDGLLTEAGKLQYGQYTPNAKDQQDIFHKGTMYDVEYLLRTASQGALIQKSWLRGITADLGYIGVAPIELHLGKSLRFWGMLSGMTVNHTIFNEKMIPIFTSLELTFSRYPEPAAVPTN